MRNSRIVLVNAHRKSDDYAYNSPTEHLGIASLAAYLRREGYSRVELIDGYALGMSPAEIAAELHNDPPRLVGITFEYNTFPEAMALARLVKERDPSTIVVCGGEHATYAGAEILTGHPEVDYVVRGEGESTLAELCAGLTGPTERLEEIKGLCFRHPRTREIIQTTDRPAISNLDELPFPARDTLERMLARGQRPAIALLGSRGCPAKCSFCNAYKFFNIGGGARWRARSAEHLVDELEMLLKRYGDEDVYPVVYFGDENFVGPRRQGIPRVRRFAELILKRGLNVEYEIFCRTDSFNDEDELIGLLKKSGLISVLMGIEAASDDQLTLLRKGANAVKNSSAVELFQRHHIVTSSSGFLMFNPYSTMNDLRTNADFLLRIGQATLYNMSCRVHAYPGIKMTDDLKQEGLMQAGAEHFEVDKISFVNPSVGKVADLLTDETSLLLSRREDSAMRNLDLNLARILRFFGAEVPMEEVVNTFAVDEVLKSKRRVQERTHQFFVGLLDEAENGRLERELFQERYQKYSVALTEVLDELDLALNQTLTLVSRGIEQRSEAT